ACAAAAVNRIVGRARHALRARPRTLPRRRPAGVRLTSWDIPARQRDVRAKSRRPAGARSVPRRRPLHPNAGCVPSRSTSRLETQPNLVLGPHLDGLATVCFPQPLHPASPFFFQRLRVDGSAERGWLGRGTWRVNPKFRSHRQPVCGRTATPHRSVAYRATSDPLHNPPSGGRFFKAANNSARWASESVGRPWLVARRSASPSGPCSFHRLSSARTLIRETPTTSATWVGVRCRSVRRRSQMACHRVFSTLLRQARYWAQAWFAVRWRITGNRRIGLPPKGSS